MEKTCLINTKEDEKGIAGKAINDRYLHIKISRTFFIPIVVFILQSATITAQVPDLAGGPMDVERVAARTHHPAYKSAESGSPDATAWIQVDLGKSYPIEMVKLYPYISLEDFKRPGFPLRYRIEAADEEFFTHPKLISDQTNEDYKITVVEKIDSYQPEKPVSGRFVRLTVTKMQNHADKYYFDLWRFEVISGGKNVAEQKVLTDSSVGYLGKHTLLRPQRPLGESVVLDQPENVTSPDTWSPVKPALQKPNKDVSVGGIFNQTLDRNRHYLVNAFTVNDILYDFRERAGWTDLKKDRDYWSFWVDPLRGSNAGRYLMGAGNQLRWKDDAELRKGLNEIVDGIVECAEPNGYMLAFPERNILYHETAGYSRSWLTQGLIEAGISGNTKAFPLLRHFYDWYNACPYLPEVFLRGGFGIQGTIGCTRVFADTPIGVPADVQTVQRYYQLNFWLKQLTERDPDAIWQYPYDRPHNYLIGALNAYLQMYMATGDTTYREAVLGGWDIFHDYFEHTGGSISIYEPFYRFYPPKSYLLVNESEFCGSSFWAFLNQQFHLLYPDDEKYVSEIEKTIYNVALANQEENGKIRYHIPLIGHKHHGNDGNTCCEGQGTRLLGALPEFIYAIASDGLYIDLYNESSINWQQDGQELSLQLHSAFPEKPEVDIQLSLKKSMRSNIRIRVPSWATSDMAVWVNGKKVATGKSGTYISLDRIWKNKDKITFTLPMGFRLTKYAGIAEGYQGKEVYALQYGSILMALTGGNEESITTLPVSASELAAKLKPIADKPLHFSIDGVDKSIRYVPYYEIGDELFTCYPVFQSSK